VSGLLLSSSRPALCGVVNPTCTLWCAAARLAGDGALVAPIDNVILVAPIDNVVLVAPIDNVILVAPIDNVILVTTL
jgi:hypothetical protein